MPEFSIKYTTKNFYSEEMKHALIEFLILPEENETQDRLSFDLETSVNIKENIGINIFDFEIIRYRLDNSHLDFELTMNTRVRKKKVNPFDFQQLLYEDERIILNSAEFEIDNYPFLLVTQLTTLPDGFKCPELVDKEQVFEFAIRVNKFVFDELVYCDIDTNIQKTIEQTLKGKTGVCQDYTHLMLAVLRKNRIPARYVSGYLNPGTNQMGAGTVHAWVQALVPGVGWIGFDPTNRLLEDYHYIKIAHGVDINDCQNVKGVVVGPGTNHTDYTVQVTEQNKNQNQ